MIHILWLNRQCSIETLGPSLVPFQQTMAFVSCTGPESAATDTLSNYESRAKKRLILLMLWGFDREQNICGDNVWGFILMLS